MAIEKEGIYHCIIMTHVATKGAVFYMHNWVRFFSFTGIYKCSKQSCWKWWTGDVGQDQEGWSGKDDHKTFAHCGGSNTEYF